jgi:STE24 endopeptidase
MTNSFLKLSLVLLLLSISATVLRGSSLNNSAPSATEQKQYIVDASQKITAYTLPPERYRQAHELHRTYFTYRLISFAYGVGILLFLLYAKVASKLRDLAERLSGKRFVQVLIFTPLFVLILALFQLPADAYVHRLSVQYGLSIQSWSPWFADWGKQQFFTTVGAIVFVWLLYAVIRRSPRRWWFYFWLAALPIGVFLVFIQPLVVDPAFNRFEPLASKDPELATSLTSMAQQAGEDIPVERMFWMDASQKTTTLNAYVTGFGASKRIVVWDTTLEKLTTPQIVFIAGHEMGHYVLHHVIKGLVIATFGSLLLFYAGYLIVNRVIAKNIDRWKLRGVDDYASLPFLLLVITALLLVTNPVASGVSRYFEHQADQYALDITHTLTPEAGQVGAQSFQALGTQGLADPDPNPIDVFIFYDHAPIPDRIQFCLAYDSSSKK